MNVVVGKTAVDTQRKRLFPNLTVLNFPWVKYIDTIPAERFNSQTKLLKVLTIKVWKKSVNILYSFSVVLHCLGEKISTMFSVLDSIFFLLLLFESALRFSLHIVPIFRPAVCKPMTKSTISVPRVLFSSSGKGKLKEKCKFEICSPQFL